MITRPSKDGGYNSTISLFDLLLPVSVPVSAMLSTMTRPEDTIKIPRSYRGDTGEDYENKEVSEPGSPPLDLNIDTPTKVEDDTANLNGSAGDRSSGTKQGAPQLLSPEEVIDLARRSVDNGIQDTKCSLAGNEAVSDVVKPKLTIDLGHSNIGRVPETVVDIIKDEVERCVCQSFDGSSRKITSAGPGSPFPIPQDMS